LRLQCSIMYWMHSKTPCPTRIKRETKKDFNDVERKERSNQLLYADFCWNGLIKQFMAL